MTSDTVLSRFERLRETGPGRYLAPCPAHQDRSPSLSIRVLDDGRVLLHCFAGCLVEDVVAAIGLTISDLFPDRPKAHSNSTFKSPHLKPPEALMILGHEIAATAIVLEGLLEIFKAGGTPSELALARLRQSFNRINSIRNFTEEGTAPELRQIRRGAA